MDQAGGRRGTAVTTPARAGSRVGVGVAAVAMASAVTSALGYLVPVLGARTLSPADLGVLSTVMAIAGIVAVPSMGLQIAVAMPRARSPP